MRIIPQRALILATSPRENLDPEGAYATRSRFGMRSENAVLEAVLGGKSMILSPGQQHLFSFGRSLLLKRKSLCMDESASSPNETSDREI
ncbi:hypothetical protein K437DRAFT_269931 [Tilletiaria anomala UBC 951]|uniref:Uncharacterized protein n=1 Tax=Tilletiaria anomala (strain ATCC 24038 / CBS 436.72 / UBC 951) TaxID=1037660 RepID=A0A066VJU7_TILAU|nr:uncharacterized protein K437DRAFT_269931 [Tilletiaria anomala UBC 951]KDN40598.1 hypothetical protein K437DRAFT_269931 [Tilletiaria anomala UBC 951]